MGLTYVGYYAMLSEAWVVRSVLRSAGIPADVFDHHRGTMIWTQQTMLGGYRVAVPTKDLDDALAILTEVAPAPQPIKGDGWTVGAMIVGVCCFLFSIPLWGYAAARTKPAPWRTTAWVGILLLEVLAAVGLVYEMTHRPEF